MLAEVAPEPVAAVEPRVGPTPEQMRGERFKKRSSKTSHGQVSAVAYHRQPLFETLAKTGTVDVDGLRALRFYRNQFEEAAHSLTRCALDVQTGGGGMPSCLPPGAGADWTVQRCESAMGAVVDTVRAVALEDKSFSDVAIERFGGRKQNWLVQEEKSGRTKARAQNKDRTKPKPLPRFVDKIVPKSGRHREIIRDEFLLGLKRLKEAHRLLATTEQSHKAKDLPSLAELTQPGDPTPEAPRVAAPAEFLDEHGRMRPWEEVAEIIRTRISRDDPAASN